MKHIYVVHDPECLDEISAVAFTSETDAFEYLMSWWEGYLYSLFLDYVLAATKDSRITGEAPIAYAKRKLDRVIQSPDIFLGLAITRITLVD
jgi:hypothetical protein